MAWTFATFLVVLFAALHWSTALSRPFHHYGRRYSNTDIEAASWRKHPQQSNIRPISHYFRFPYPGIDQILEILTQRQLQLPTLLSPRPELTLQSGDMETVTEIPDIVADTYVPDANVLETNVPDKRVPIGQSYSESSNHLNGNFPPYSRRTISDTPFHISAELQPLHQSSPSARTISELDSPERENPITDQKTPEVTQTTPENVKSDILSDSPLSSNQHEVNMNSNLEYPSASFDETSSTVDEASLASGHPSLPESPPSLSSAPSADHPFPATGQQFSSPDHPPISSIYPSLSMEQQSAGVKHSIPEIQLAPFLKELDPDKFAATIFPSIHSLVQALQSLLLPYGCKCQAEFSAEEYSTPRGDEFRLNASEFNLPQRELSYSHQQGDKIKMPLLATSRSGDFGFPLGDVGEGRRLHMPSPIALYHRFLKRKWASERSEQPRS